MAMIAMVIRCVPRGTFREGGAMRVRFENQFYAGVYSFASDTDGVYAVKVTFPALAPGDAILLKKVILTTDPQGSNPEAEAAG